MGGGSGGSRTGRGGGGGGGGLDMTTPAKEMGIHETIAQVSLFDSAVLRAQEKLEALRDAHVSGKIDTATAHIQKSAARAEIEKLRNRHTELKDSLTRSLVGPKGSAREIIKKFNLKTKTYDVIDLGPALSTWRGHFGIPRGK